LGPGHINNSFISISYIQTPRSIQNPVDILIGARPLRGGLGMGG
jgi:hypothetical protein